MPARGHGTKKRDTIQLTDDGAVFMTTYGPSQKVLNLRRNPRVALLVVRYDALKGVLLRGDAEVVEDEARCVQVLRKIHRKHVQGLASGVGDVTNAQARKRVVLKIAPERIAS